MFALKVTKIHKLFNAFPHLGLIKVRKRKNRAGGVKNTKVVAIEGKEVHGGYRACKTAVYRAQQKNLELQVV